MIASRDTSSFAEEIIEEANTEAGTWVTTFYENLLRNLPKMKKIMHFN
jgi:hypothetical protein